MPDYSAWPDPPPSIFAAIEAQDAAHEQALKDAGLIACAWCGEGVTPAEAADHEGQHAACRIENDAREARIDARLRELDAERAEILKAAEAR